MMDMEHKLRAALQPQDPGPDFTAAVMARVPAQPAAARRRSPWLAPLAMAATLATVAIGVNWHLGQQRAEKAGAELALALQITSFELSQLQQKLAPAPAKENGS
jgi:hypothetical protein